MSEFESLIESMQASRRKFFKHVEGMTEEQCRWKPYPECKSVLETLTHLRIDDLAAMESFESNAEPRYEEIAGRVTNEAANKSRQELEVDLKGSHSDMLDLIRAKFAQQQLTAEICVWGSMKPLCVGLPILSSEDYYHAGQVAFIRMAQDPDWNYYAAIYGDE